MAMHEWSEIERDLFPPDDEEKISELENEMRAQVRAYKLAKSGACQLCGGAGRPALSWSQTSAMSAWSSASPSQVEGRSG